MRWWQPCWVGMLRTLSRMTFLIGFRVRFFGATNVPERGGVLIVSNHQSYFDPILLGVGLERWVMYMARSTLFKHFGLGWLLRSVLAHPLDREGRDVAALRLAISILEEGGCLVIFPEGTRTIDGSVAQFRHGPLVIADRAKAPIVPAAVDGAFQAWPKGHGIKPHPIRVKYGRPISFAERQTMTRDECAARLRNEVLALQRELREMQQ